MNNAPTKLLTADSIGTTQSPISKYCDQVGDLILSDRGVRVKNGDGYDRLRSTVKFMESVQSSTVVRLQPLIYCVQ